MTRKSSLGSGSDGCSAIVPWSKSIANEDLSMMHVEYSMSMSLELPSSRLYSSGLRSSDDCSGLASFVLCSGFLIFMRARCCQAIALVGLIGRIGSGVRLGFLLVSILVRGVYQFLTAAREEGELGGEGAVPLCVFIGFLKRWRVEPNDRQLLNC